MIYTVTLNPALDHYLEIDDLVMDDANRVTAESCYAGGKGIDVSRAIRHLGGQSLALGFIGGRNGQTMMELLKRDGVTSYFTTIAQETRRNIIINPQRRRFQTMLHSVGPVIAREEWDSFLTHLRALDLRESYVVVGGSLPRGLPEDAYRQIVELVHEREARAVVDADGACMRAALEAKPYAIKPNVNELRRIIGQVISSEEELLEAARFLNRRGVAVVIVSRGAEGLLAVSKEGWFKTVPPKVTVRSTVGAGDSTVAGFVFQYANGKRLDECVRFATACGTAATLAPGNQLCRHRDVQRLLPQIHIERLNRGRRPGSTLRPRKGTR